MTDQEYIKMILALDDEFFKGWEWKAGDKYLINYGDYWDIGFIGDSSIENGEAGYYFITVGEFQKFREELRPLPSQEQLQKMLIDFENEDSKYKHSNYFIISERFIAVVIEGDLVANMENKTLTEMWLEFVVYLMYNKTWNGEKWL